MAKRVHKFYSPAEKSVFLARIEELYEAGGRTYTSIARELGLNDTSYHNWRSQGFKPTPKTPAAVAVPSAQRVFDASDRVQLVGNIDALRARGSSMKAACLAVGISDKSYRTWKAAAAPRLPMRVVEMTALVPMPTVATALTIVPPTGPALAGRELGGAPIALALVAPGGYRIEGLGIETAAQLLRALS
jgi:transposase-like protein